MNREKYGAKHASNPKGINCFTSNIVIPKFGLGYNLATADNRNKKDKIILKLHGKNLVIDFMCKFILILSNIIEQFERNFFLTLS